MLTSPAVKRAGETTFIVQLFISELPKVSCSHISDCNPLVPARYSTVATFWVYPR